MVEYLTKKGVSYTELSKATDIPKTILRNAGQYNFTNIDSLNLSTQYNYFLEFGKLIENEHFSINKNLRKSDKKKLIEVYRDFELRGNEQFIKRLQSNVITYNSTLIDKFIDKNIDCIASIKYSFMSNETTEKEINEKANVFFQENNAQRLYQDSIASYLTQIHNFRSDGISRLVKANSPLNYEKIKIHIDSVPATLNYGVNGLKDCTYHIVAFLDNSIETIFSPINWLISLIPQKLLIVIILLVLIATAVCLYLHIITFASIFGITDIILILISVIRMMYGDPYSDIRKGINDECQLYFQEQFEKQLTEMNNNTNLYYDHIQSLF